MTKPHAPKMKSVTVRLPDTLVRQLDDEAERLARRSGVATITRSDAVRALLERSLGGRS